MNKVNITIDIDNDNKYVVSTRKELEDKERCEFSSYEKRIQNYR